MDVFDLDDALVKDYERFARSFTKIRAEDIRSKVDALYQSRRFWPEPLISINPHFERGASVQDLVAERSLHPHTARVFRIDGEPIRLYRHQEQAVAKATARQSFVVTTGTGSGKSLCFFVPIIDAAIRARAAGESSRTRAIVVYPMNALANSQMKELEKFIEQSGLAGGLRPTFARYTGQEDEDERKLVSESKPDILLTNFMMLELLMTRQNERDRTVISNAEGLDFLVLDELHTYRGRQGADVAMLVRRVRDRLCRNKAPICIGTSATMASEGGEESRAIAVANVASRLFGTPISPDAVIDESLSDDHPLGHNQRAGNGHVRQPDFTGYSGYISFDGGNLCAAIERKSGQASDDGLPSGVLITSWSEVNGPAAVTFANPNQLSTQVTVPVAGTYQLRLTATDTQLTSYSDTYVNVNPGDQAPQITLNPSSLTISLSNPTTTLSANILISPGGTPSFLWTQVGTGAPIVFSSPSSLTTNATFATEGAYYVQLAVSDGTLSSTAQLTVNVAAPIPAPPVVALLTPQNAQQITAPIGVIGTVTTAGQNVGGPGSGWVLDYSLNTQDGASTQSWTVLASASYSFPGANASLGTLDPTVLLNGTYTLRLTATDNYGQTSVTTEPIMVSKNAKPGDFLLSFTDLSVPVAGLPITITRTYDSRDHGFHDFGSAWSLSVANVRIEKSGQLGKNWVEYGTGGGFSNFCLQTINNALVTATFPDGTQYVFQPVATPQCQQIVPMTAATIGFTELPGSPGTEGATLVPADGGQVLTDGSVPGNVNLVDYNAEPYNPTTFILTTRDGHQYTIDQTLGVTNMADANGNTLTISSTGIVSSTGKSITFTRDSLNRITQIADPNGNTLKYVYNASAPEGNGMLNTFTDGTGNTTTFYYGGQNFTPPPLSTIIGPNGVQVAASQYDATGHLIQLTDANGKPTNFAINETSQTETVTDRNGNPTTYTYDADGNILTETDALGKTSSYTYDPDDNKLSETNPLNETTTYTYDASDNRLSQADALGNTTKYSYNAAGQVLTVVDPLGHTTTNVYDSNNNLLSTTDANGKTTSSVYTANGLPSSVTDAAGNTTQFQYDGSGNLTQQTDALGNLSTYTYDANNNKLSQTVTRTVNGQPQTQTTSYAYDGNNRLTKTTYPDGTTTQTQYNSIGKQSVTIDQLSRQTSYAYDSLGRLTTTTYPDNTTASTTYDANNNRLTSTDRAGHTTSYTYDVDNRLTKTTYADQSFTQTVYDAAGRVSSTVDANGNSTSYGYDNAGRRTTLTDALTHVTTFAYDNSGNQISVKDARQNTTQYQYDSLNRQIAVVYPDQTTSSTAYDNLGRVITKTDQAGKVTGYGYDALGRLTSVTQDAVQGGLNLLTQYGYDQVGNRISQTDANNHTTTYQYDQLGRRIGRILPAGQSESYVYDAAGNLKSKTDFNGKTTTYAYDTSNRLLSKTPDASFAAPPVGFTYFANGLRQTMADVSGTTTFGYDTRNRLTSKQTPFGTLSYTYDNAGDVLTLNSSNADGASLTYTYDTLNRLSTVTDNRLLAQGATSGVTTYNYDAVGNLQNFSYPNGVTSAYSYDALNRLTQMGSSKSSASISNYAYTLGLAGNRLTVAELSGRAVGYAYDSLYRLTSETVTSDPSSHNFVNGFTYDAVGNRKQWLVNGVLSNAYTYDPDDRLGSDQYDGNGNTVLSAGVADAYDFENHLIQKGAVTLAYDGDGNRVLETVGGVTTNYLVDTINPTGYAQVVDELVGGAVTRTYSYGLERINENQILNSTWTPSFYGYDGHGSVRQLTNAAGSITDSYDYDAFGNLVNQTGSTPNNYLFAGEQYDPALGLYYNRARYLSTTTGRFWSMDTQQGGDRAPLSLHKYLYAEGDPADHMDPSGNQIDDIVGALAVAIVVVAISVPTANETLDTINSPQVLGPIAQSNAQLLVGSALAAVTNTALFAKYFGQPANAQREALITNNYGMISAYLQDSITYNLSTTPGEFAHVFTNIPDQIWLGPAFFSAPWVGIDSKPGTIVHEVSHLALLTGDHVYGEAAAIGLAANQPDVAVQNADNYEYFAERSAMPPAQQNAGP